MLAAKNAVKNLVNKHNLSKRQEDVLIELIKNPRATSEELAPLLSLSPSTINVHLSKIFEKVGVKSKRQLLDQIERMTLDLGGSKKLQMLCVDDDPVFQKRFVDAVAQIAGDKVNMICGTSGLEALMHLSRSKKNEEGFPRPDIIILDLVMPIMDGISCLNKIKADPDLAAIPVVVFSSQSEKDLVKQVYSKGSNSFVLKPKSEQELLNVVRLILQYWGQIGLLPENSA